MTSWYDFSSETEPSSSLADTSFMYIITCLGIVKLYQTRHPDIAANAHSVYAGFALIILIAVFGVVSILSLVSLKIHERCSNKLYGRTLGMKVREI